MHTFKENKVGREQISWNKIHHGHKQKSFVAKGIKIEKKCSKGTLKWFVPREQIVWNKTYLEHKQKTFIPKEQKLKKLKWYVPYEQMHICCQGTFEEIKLGGNTWVGTKYIGNINKNHLLRRNKNKKCIKGTLKYIGFWKLKWFVPRND